MKIIGVDHDLMIQLNTLELEDQILHGADDFVKADIVHKGRHFLLCHFVIRERPISVILEADEPANTIHIHSWREGHLAPRDYPLKERGIWLSDD